MNRTIRSLLGLAAATAVLTVGVPALTSSASAATTTTTASSFDNDYWGPYYSRYFDDSRAKATGRVWDEDSGRVHVQGKLYDKNTPQWLCGYVQVKFENSDGDESYYWARQCGSNGYRSFHFAEDDVDNAQVRVCYWDNHQAKRISCGKWNYVFEADGGDDDE
ncbi:hypothetical protein AB0395_42340 [Streptosporangium sp. NPDC051023]|uniref:hypothetical protein n=1 Tax=Streptosporangium sp. NPDC051023 TaxID=3155410 RepID=UPI00344CCFC1